MLPGGPGTVGIIPAEKLPDAASLIREASVNRSPRFQAAANWRRSLEDGIGQIGVPGKMAAASLARHGAGDLGRASILFNVVGVGRSGWQMEFVHVFGLCTHAAQRAIFAGKYGFRSAWTAESQSLKYGGRIQTVSRARWTLGKWKLTRK